MDLSIIIVNWNSTEFTKNCIASIRSTTKDMDYEIVVVDNDSQDGSAHLLSELVPPVILICSDRNLGFARANNLGAEHAKGAKLLFLNPDTLVLEGSIRRMSDQLDSGPKVAAAGCRLLNGDLTLQMSCVQSFPNIANQLLGIDWLKRLWPRLSLWKMQTLYSVDTWQVAEVEVVSGACLMVRKAVFDVIGGFSTEYFLYAEETDLCYKIRRGGWKVHHVKDATVVHLGGQSTMQKGDGFVDAMMRQSIFMFFRKFRGEYYAELYRAAMLLSAVVRMITLLPLLTLPKRLATRNAAFGAFRKWRNIAHWSLALRRS
jgi:GT2 family glycosyltransferase